MWPGSMAGGKQPVRSRCSASALARRAPIRRREGDRCDSSSRSRYLRRLPLPRPLDRRPASWPQRRTLGALVGVSSHRQDSATRTRLHRKRLLGLAKMVARRAAQPLARRVCQSADSSARRSGWSSPSSREMFSSCLRRARRTTGATGAARRGGLARIVRRCRRWLDAAYCRRAWHLRTRTGANRNTITEGDMGSTCRRW